MADSSKCRFGYPKPVVPHTHITALKDRDGHEFHQLKLARTIDDVETNNYNPQILLANQGNMDLQIVVDKYAVAQSITSYISG